MKSLQVRVEDDVHRRIRFRMIELDITIQAYVLELILNDLEKSSGAQNAETAKKNGR